jgi:hypothetical protein
MFKTNIINLNIDNLILNSLPISLASLPEGAIIYKNSYLVKSELANYANKPGIYL